MSYSHMEKVTCPKCGHEQEIRICNSINSSMDIEDRDRLLRNQLFTMQCETCQETTPLLYDCLYHDMENKVMLWLKPQVNVAELENMNHTLRQMQPQEEERDYRYRIVRTVNELKEKITIVQENLDDRVIELLKVVYVYHAAEKIGDRVVSEILFDIIDDGYFFTIFFEDEKADPAVMMLDMEIYRQMKEKFQESLEQMPKEEFVEVAFDWAKDMLLT